MKKNYRENESDHTVCLNFFLNFQSTHLRIFIPFPRGGDGGGAPLNAFVIVRERNSNQASKPETDCKRKSFIYSSDFRNWYAEKQSPEKWSLENWSPKKCISKIVFRQKNARKYERLFCFYRLIPQHTKRCLRFTSRSYMH